MDGIECQYGWSRKQTIHTKNEEKYFWRLLKTQILGIVSSYYVADILTDEYVAFANHF